MRVRRSRDYRSGSTCGSHTHVGKYTAEAKYLPLYKVQVKIARIFNPYWGGLRNDDGSAIS